MPHSLAPRLSSMAFLWIKTCEIHIIFVQCCWIGPQWWLFIIGLDNVWHLFGAIPLSKWMIRWPSSRMRMSQPETLTYCQSDHQEHISMTSFFLKCISQLVAILNQPPCVNRASSFQIKRHQFLHVCTLDWPKSYKASRCLSHISMWCLSCVHLLIVCSLCESVLKLTKFVFWLFVGVRCCGPTIFFSRWNTLKICSIDYLLCCSSVVFWHCVD